MYSICPFSPTNVLSTVCSNLEEGKAVVVHLLTVYSVCSVKIAINNY